MTVRWYCALLLTLHLRSVALRLDEDDALGPDGPFFEDTAVVAADQQVAASQLASSSLASIDLNLKDVGKPAAAAERDAHHVVQLATHGAESGMAAAKKVRLPDASFVHRTFFAVVGTFVVGYTCYACISCVQMWRSRGRGYKKAWAEKGVGKYWKSKRGMQQPSSRAQVLFTSDTGPMDK
eukprot:TRINITY_DN31423_c0_g1_i1.p1 TRINITY_DN31423_c0_g1~~TRINITY_DN31423_c0_g1_i1.p1  ORF type:complete len:181 (+),score=29.31 TRINITY_DN31423_c0_g1_i1:91-633(+)